MVGPASLIASGAEGLVKGIGSILDDLFTSDEERAKARLALMQVEQLPALKNIELNMQEAKHSSIFVAGWRPFIGWVCGAGLAYQIILRPLIEWGFLIAGQVIQNPPSLDLKELIALLCYLLGYGGYRTYEKVKGVVNPGKKKDV
jgi:hypothetical protein